MIALKGEHLNLFGQSGKIATCLFPVIFVNFIASAASALPLVFNKLPVARLFSISDIILQVTSNTNGFFYKSFVAAFTLMGILCFINKFISFIGEFSIVNKATVNEPV